MVPKYVKWHGSYLRHLWLMAEICGTVDNFKIYYERVKVDNFYWFFFGEKIRLFLKIL